MKEEEIIENKFDASAFTYLVLFSNLFLFISSYWFSYRDFYLGLMIVSIFLIGALFFMRRLLVFILSLNILFYGYFLFVNFNYVFIFGICIVLGVLGLHFLRPHLNIPSFVYSFILLFILGHLIWFNFLPFGYEDSFRLNLGSTNDDSVSSDIYIIDSNRVLSPAQSYGTQTWRAFEKDGTFNVGLSSPIDFTNKTVEVSLRYDAAGPIYINGELFYDPKWGSGVIYGQNDEDFIYGAKEFNISYGNFSDENIEFDTIEEYFDFYFPKGVLVKDFTGNYGELEKKMNDKYIESINSVSYYDGFSSEPQSAFVDYRGPVKFYGVFGDSINLNFFKQDLNLYNGSDDVIITLRDFNNQIIDSKIIPDNDGVIVRTTEESIWEEYSVNFELEKEGIYKIEFDHHFESEDPDFLIGNLTFNSNKVMYDGSFHLWSPGRIYNSYDNNSLSVRYWWSGYDQIVKFSNNSEFDLNDDLKGSWVDFNLSKGDYIEFEKGKLIVDPQFNLAVFPDTKIDTELVGQVQITKSLELAKENIQLININGLNITSVTGTKISRIDVEIN